MKHSDFSKLRLKWSSTVVARTEVHRFTGGLVTSKTMANMDSLGLGPQERIRIGGKVAYPIDALIDWLEKRVQEG